MNIMQMALVLMLTVLGVAALISGAIYVVNRQKALPPFKDVRSKSVKKPLLTQRFPKRRGA